MGECAREACSHSLGIYATTCVHLCSTRFQGTKGLFIVYKKLIQLVSPDKQQTKILKLGWVTAYQDLFLLF